MSDMKDLGIPIEVRGRKGGGKGGSGGRVDKDNLLTDSTAYILGLIGEGEIEGLANEEVPESCILLDGVPIKNDDGSDNIEGVEWWLRTGTPDQDPIPGFAAVENEVDVGAKVEAAASQERTITSTETDAVRVKVSTPALVNVTEQGDRLETEVAFRILVKPGAAAWEEVKSETIRGKTTSGYQRSYRIELPDIRPLIVRIERVTPDSENENLQNDLYFSTITEIIDAKLSYPDCAVIGLAIPAKAVGGGVQRISVKVRGMKCLVPSNYDPIARTYDETTFWDGTFKLAWTRNPVWATYTTFVEKRWGLGEAISAEMFDKWTAYQQAKYCDVLVPDGQGGMEHRFSLDGTLNSRDAAYAWITKLSAAFRAVTYWGAGAVVPVQDAPSDPVRLVTNSDVENAEFIYSGTPMSARHTSAVVSIQDADDHNKIKPLASYENFEALERYGEILTEVTAPFKQSLGEGLRIAKWAVETNATQAEIVSFVGGFGFQAIRPGDVIMVSDKYRIGHRRAGRMVSVSHSGGVSHIELDAPVDLPNSETHQVWLSNDLGQPQLLTVTTTGDDLTTLSLNVALGAEFKPGSRFLVQSSNLTPRLYKVLQNKPDEKKKTFEIKAVEYDSTKFDRVEQNISIKTDPGHLLPSADTPTAPTGLNLTGFFRPDSGSKSKVTLEASWAPHSNPLVQSYMVLIKSPSSPWREVPNVKETAYEWQSLAGEEGTYRVRVAAVNAIGRVGTVAEATFEILADAQKAIAPSGWIGRSGTRSITLEGPESNSPSFSAFRVYGANASSEDLTYLGQAASSYFYRNVPAGDPYVRYKISEVRHGVGEGPLSGFITAYPQPLGATDLGQEVWNRVRLEADESLSGLNVSVEEIAESGALAMARERAEEIRQGDRLTSAIFTLNNSINEEGVARAEAVLQLIAADQNAVSLIANESTARASGDQANTNALSSYISSNNTALAAVISDISTLVTENDAQANSLGSISVQLGNVSASLSNESTARANGDLVNTNALNAYISSNNAALAVAASDISTLIDENGAQAASISSLSSSVGSISSTVTQHATAIAETNGKLIAAITLRAKAGTSGAELELVSANDPEGGSVSAARLRAENILLDGTVKAKTIEAGGISRAGSSEYVHVTKYGTGSTWTSWTSFVIPNMPLASRLHGNINFDVSDYRLALNPSGYSGDQAEVRLLVNGASVLLLDVNDLQWFRQDERSSGFHSRNFVLDNVPIGNIPIELQFRGHSQIEFGYAMINALAVMR